MRHKRVSKLHNDGLSPNGKALDSDSSIFKVRILVAQLLRTRCDLVLFLCNQPSCRNCACNVRAQISIWWSMFIESLDERNLIVQNCFQFDERNLIAQERERDRRLTGSPLYLWIFFCEKNNDLNFGCLRSYLLSFFLIVTKL